MAEPAAAAALLFDAALGWPAALYRRIGHPVGLFAHIIGACEAAWNRQRFGDCGRRALGMLTVALLLATAAGGGFVALALCRRLFGAHAWIAVAVLAWPALAQRSLFDHVRPVARHLARGDVPAARLAVAMIVGRDTDALDAGGVARAALESLAESFCDGVVAPLFWFIVGGLPGVWAYKAVNTADSLIGHREERWRAFGWASARTDDLMNLAPARLSGLLLCLAGGGGWRTLWRYHGRHASPNAGWPEAAMAGALGLRLGGPACYDGVLNDRPWIGDGREAADAGDVRRGLGVYVRGCLLLWVGAAWVEGWRWVH